MASAPMERCCIGQSSSAASRTAPNQTGDRGVGGRDADHLGAAIHLLVEPLELFAACSVVMCSAGHLAHRKLHQALGGEVDHPAHGDPSSVMVVGPRPGGVGLSTRTPPRIIALPVRGPLPPTWGIAMRRRLSPPYTAPGEMTVPRSFRFDDRRCPARLNRHLRSARSSVSTLPWRGFPDGSRQEPGRAWSLPQPSPSGRRRAGARRSRG